MALNLKKHYKSYLISFIIAIVVGLIPFFLVSFINGSALDGVTLAAIILLGLGGLMFVANEGFFDIFAYGFKQMGTAMFGKKPNANNDFPGYKEDKRLKREESPKIFFSFLIAGCIFLLALIILKIIFFTL